MKILFYMLPRDITGTEKSHVFEVMNNLHWAGAEVCYANGKKFVPVDIGRLGIIRKDGRPSRLVRLKEWLLARPLGGEAMLGKLFFEELKLLVASIKGVTKKRPDVIYRRHSPIYDTAYLVGRLWRIPVVKEVNGIIEDEFESKKLVRKLTLRLVGAMEKFNFRKAGATIVVTPRLKELLSTEFGVDTRSIHVIPNGANSDLFHPGETLKARKKLGLDPDLNYLCFSGALVVWQSVDLLIKSMPMVLEKCPRARLLVVGDGSRRDELMGLALQLGVADKMIFTGMVPYSRVPDYVNASDVCLLPEARLPRNERIGASPLKLGEYLACAKPVVACRLLGIEVLEQRDAGIVVEPEDPQAMAAAIVDLLEDSETRRRMGNNGRLYIETERSWKIVSEKTLAVCEDLAEKQQASLMPV